MKKHFLSCLLFVIVMASSCTQEDVVQQMAFLSESKFVATFEQNNSRTYLENGKYLRWTANDELSIFMGKTLNKKFRFDGETGDNSGGFEDVSTPGFVTGNDLDNPCHYAIYPYAKGTKITETGILTVNLPSEQTYEENSFGCGANTMVAVTSSLSDMELSFKNACGYLKFKLYGDNVTVKSVTLQSNGEEKLSGTATLTAAYNKNPSITMSSTASDMITLDCGTGVKIGSTAETATAFWIVVPPTTFESGFTIIIKDVNDNEFTKSTSKKISIERNIIKPISAFEVEIAETIPNNQIWYTTSNGEMLTPAISNAFNTTIKSNTYKDGKGIITFYEDVTTIGYRAFYSRYLLTSITLPNSITSIGDQAFYYCDDLTKITTPNSLRTIGEEAFYYCSELTNFEIPNGVISIEDKAFYGCNALTKASIPGSLKDWGLQVFMSCKNLTDVIVNNGVTEIGNQAFYGCSNLINISLPESLNNIGHGVFMDCTKLSSIKIPNNITIIGEHTFSGCESLNDITIPDAVTTIVQCAFYGCSSLKNVVLSNNLKTIQWAAFVNCVSLTEISLPKSLETIYGYAFEGCTKLKNVYCSSLTPPVIGCTDDYGRWGAFDNNATGRLIYVPTTSVSAYKSQQHWMDYSTNILGYDFE